MVLTKILASYTFRFAVGAVIILSMVVMFVMVVVYGVFSYNYFHDVHDELSAELTEISAVYDRGGIAAFDAYLEGRRSSYDTVQFAYMLVDNRLTKLAGDLENWPRFREYGEGWLSFELGILQRDGDSREHEFVGRSLQLPDGNQLLVARSYEIVLGYIRFVAGILIRGFLVTVCLGTFGAFFISWALQRRLDTINQSIKTIMAGDLSERLQFVDSPSEIEQLAVNLNEMLDRIQYLMDGVKQVSDNIAHDLRTPLTRLRNHLAKFEQRCSDDDLPMVRELIVEADDILVTFNALLRIARIELGESRSEKTHIRLDVLVGDVVDLYEPVASEKHVALEVNLQRAEVIGDRNLLFQAVANVVDNAIKYTPQGGHVVVKIGLNDRQEPAGFADQSEQCVELIIADSGCGIAEQNRDKVFRRFYREESSRSRQPGNGLGLSLVAAVMKMHKSVVVLEDNTPGLTVKMFFRAAIEVAEQQRAVQLDSSMSVNPEVSTSSLS